MFESITARSKRIFATKAYVKWRKKIKDPLLLRKLAFLLVSAKMGRMSGDFKNLGGGLTEIKLDFGPGYRIYLTEKNEEIIILLAGGDKSTQENDIQKAREMISAGFEEEKQWTELK